MPERNKFSTDEIKRLTQTVDRNTTRLFRERMIELVSIRTKLPLGIFRETEGGKYSVLWLVNRQKPSIDAYYDFDEERFGITIGGHVIWGFHSGCSCPTPWGKDDYRDNYHTQRSWKEFILSELPEFDKDWEEEAIKMINQILLITRKDVSAHEIGTVENVELRRFILEAHPQFVPQMVVRVLDEDGEHNKLIQMEDHRIYLWVKDGSSDKMYLIPSHQRCRSVRDALAWSFNMQADEYKPLTEA